MKGNFVQSNSWPCIYSYGILALLLRFSYDDLQSDLLCVLHKGLAYQTGAE